MKIEKVSDNQIRCTLTREDLDDRQIKISEIAYGSEKAKLLFRDMMQQANYEFGFEAEDIPLMIEAIPMSSGCIVFIITKVEDPEELDTRFSKFAPSVHEEDDSYEEDSDENNDLIDEGFSAFCDKDESKSKIQKDLSENENKSENGITSGFGLPKSAEDMFDLFRRIASKSAKAKAEKPDKYIPGSGVNNRADAAKSTAGTSGEMAGRNGEKSTGNVGGTTDKGKLQPKVKNPLDTSEKTQSLPSIRIFSFDHLDTLTDAAYIIHSHFRGSSMLYKNPDNNLYYLVLDRENNMQGDFIKICNLLLEYSNAERYTPSTIAYMKEHFHVIIPENAVDALAQI
ncbi:MAG: adaptor protein MecA [Lachnospiraceae bacterium]